MENTSCGDDGDELEVSEFEIYKDIEHGDDEVATSSVDENHNGTKYDRLFNDLTYWTFCRPIGAIFYPGIF